MTASLEWISATLSLRNARSSVASTVLIHSGSLMMSHAKICRLVSVALEQRTQHAIEKSLAVSRIGEHMRAPAHLHAARGARRIAPEKIEQHEHDPDAMAARDLERRVDIPEHEIVESERAAAVAESNAGAAVAEEKPPHVSARPTRQARANVSSSCARSSGLRDSALGPPRIGAEVDAVVHPGQIGADQKRRRQNRRHVTCS